MKKYTFLVLFISFFSFGQDFLDEVFTNDQESILYYDENWKGTTKDKAEYYRVFKSDSTNKPIGGIRDYYITGELQCAIEGAAYIDKDDDSKSITSGNITWYYKSGKISKKLKANGSVNVQRKDYYESGNLRLVVDYEEDGQEIKMPYLLCDENRKCQNIYTATKNNLATNDKSIPTERGFELKKGGSYFIKHKIKADEFILKATITPTSGGNLGAYGIVFGFKDWDNYMSFYITKDKSYKINHIYNGIDISPNQTESWDSSSNINSDKPNILQVSKFGNDIYFSVNQKLLGSIEGITSLYGDFHGVLSNDSEKNYVGIFSEPLSIFETLSQNSAVAYEQNSNEWKGNGSGLIISKDGHIITNNHVVEGTNKIEVEFIFNDEIKTFNAEIVQVDKVNDLAIIKISDLNFTGVDDLPYNFKTRSSDVGTKVYAYGYPMALTLMGKEIKITDGIISSKSGFEGDITSYQITAPIQGGNSGGPLFDDKGNLLGINSSGINKEIADNVGYTIKSNYVLNLIDVLPKKIELPSNTKLQSLPLTEQIKEIAKYVVLIKVK
tara:strand:+ start:435 stop:2096 length:1662 start_codon:yes stop_codon:yes gene_type:complete